MPRVKLTKSAIDALPTAAKDVVFWDSGCPGFGVKVTPRGRKVFIVLYRGAGSRLRKYTIGPYGRVTLHQGRTAALKIFAARADGRDPAAEKQTARRRSIIDRVEDLIELYIAERVSHNRSAREISRLLRREVIPAWGNRSVHEIGRREVSDLVYGVAARGTPSAANKLLKVSKTFFGWCVGRAILDASPAQGLSAPGKERSRDRLLTDAELTAILVAGRQMNDPYGKIVELLALTGQRREEVARMTWEELDLTKKMWTIPASRTKNAKPHMVHLSKQSLMVLMGVPKVGAFVFSLSGKTPFQGFSRSKRELDDRAKVEDWRLHDLRRTCVSGMARLGVAPHVADKVLNHQAGVISGVAAVYQRHEFLPQRKEALDRWGAHVEGLLRNVQHSLVA